MEAPKVFVSHASEDKERFVLGFAERLRANGVDAWLDRWEMGPGDSLIDKIFNEGIKEADAFLVVLSANSIEKPWVKQELDVACVNRINNGSRLIPVVLDDCEVPQVLTSTVWEPVKDVDSYDAAFGRILDSIFGTVRKPPLGTAPAAYSGFHKVSNIEGIDAFVYKEACAEAFRSESYSISLRKVFLSKDNPAISEDELYDSFEYLADQGVFEKFQALDGKPDEVTVSEAGLELYARQYVPSLETAYKTISLALVNGTVKSLFGAHDRCGQGRLLTEHVFRSLASSGDIKVYQMLDGDMSVVSVSPSLRRKVAS